jgi:adenine deaminase
VADGVIHPDASKDVAMTAMIDRLGRGSGMAVAFVKGFRLRAGAIASTHNAVCENLAIVGTNGVDMAFASEELRRMGGGQVVVRDGKVLAAFRMPILGLFSDQSYEEVLDRRRERRRNRSDARSTIHCSNSNSASSLAHVRARSVPHRHQGTPVRHRRLTA